jgi:hypothetical protein
MDKIKDFIIVFIIDIIIIWGLGLAYATSLSYSYHCTPEWVSVSDRNPTEINMYYARMLKDNKSYFFSIAYDNQGWKNPYKNYTIEYWLEDNCWNK